MRQTRRSRSALTPQKDEPANQAEEVNVGEEKSVKTNLETVFEKEDNLEKGSEAVEDTSADKVDDAMLKTEENQTPTIENATAEEEKQDDVSKNSGSPRKSDTGLIELNCQVCNCSFTNYHEHMNSESHKSKISHSPLKTDTQTSAEKPATNQAQKRSGDQDSAPSPKRMKNQNSSNVSNEKFNCDICKLTIMKQQDYEQHMNGRRHMLNVTRAQGKSYCEICKLFFNSPSDLSDHEESQMHKKNLADRKQDKQQIECKLCQVISLGQKQYEQHLTSKRHKRSLEQPGTVAKPAAAVNGKTEAKAEAKAEAKPAAAVVAASEKKWLYLCNACNFGCNFDNQLSSHMNLAEHKAAVIDMKKKGLMKDKEGAKSSPAKFANKPAAANKPATANAAQPTRKFTPGNAGNRTNAGVNKPGPKPNFNAAGPGPSVTYNIVSGPNANAPAVQKPGPQVNRKAPAAGPTGVKKNIPPNKPAAVMNKPPFAGRPNPRFPGKPAENAPNKFVANQQPMKMGFQNPAVGFRNSAGNFGTGVAPHHETIHSGGNFGAYRAANFGGNMRMDVNPVSDMRNDFRGNVRDDFHSDVRGIRDIRDVRDIRDIRNVDTSSSNRGDAAFRSGFYREMPAESSRGDFRTFNDMDTRSDVRSGPVVDAGDMRSLTRNDMADLRGYSNNDMRDLQSDSRNDYSRERSTMSAYGASAAFGQTYRGNEEYRSDNYGRAAQPTASATSGNYSSGMMSSGRYDYMDRNSSAYSNQYSASSRGMGYMGNVSLNGR